MIQQKRGMSGWIWFLIVAVLIAVCIGIYFWLSGGSDGGSSVISGGNSISQPPALPTG